MDLTQTDKYSEKEIELLKKMFGGDNITLLTLHKLLFQFKLSKEEQKLLQFGNDEITLLRKIFLPENSPETPMNWTLNMYHCLTPIREFSLDGATVHIKANDILIQYITQQFEELIGESDEVVNLDGLTRELSVGQDEQRFINMLAFNNICAYIKGRIGEIQDRANPPVPLTPEQQKAKDLANRTE